MSRTAETPGAEPELTGPQIVPDAGPPTQSQARPVTGTSVRDRITGGIGRLLLGNLAGRIGALASLGIATILVARIGGPSLVGAFTLVRILPGLICHLSNAGLPGAAPYFLAGNGHDQARVRPTLASLAVAGAVLGGLAWLALSPLLHRLFFTSFGFWVAVAAAGPSFTQGFVSVGKGLLQGSDDLRGASLAIAIEEFVFLPIYLLLLIGWYGPGALITGLVLADIAAAAWIVVRLARRGFFTGWGRPDLGLAKRISGYGMRGQLGQLIDLLNLRLDVAFLGAMAGPAVLGVYTVASKFAELVQLPGLAANYVLYPDFARQDAETATRRTRALILPALAVSALSALPLALMTGTVLPLVFGDAFDGAVLPTYLLLAGLVTYGVSSLFMAFLYGIGRPGLTSLAQATGLAATVVLDLVLIPHFGATGAAVASAVSYTTTTAVLSLFFIRSKATPGAQAPRTGATGETDAHSRARTGARTDARTERKR